jgi:hypothetical protein
MHCHGLHFLCTYNTTRAVCNLAHIVPWLAVWHSQGSRGVDWYVTLRVHTDRAEGAAEAAHMSFFLRLSSAFCLQPMIHW